MVYIYKENVYLRVEEKKLPQFIKEGYKVAEEQKEVKVKTKNENTK